MRAFSRQKGWWELEEKSLRVPPSQFPPGPESLRESRGLWTSGNGDSAPATFARHGGASAARARRGAAEEEAPGGVRGVRARGERRPPSRAQADAHGREAVLVRRRGLHCGLCARLYLNYAQADAHEEAHEEAQEESQEESREKEDGHAHKDSGEVEDNNYVAVGVIEAEEYGYVPAVTSDAEYYCTDKDTDAYKSDDGYDGNNGYDGYGSNDEFDNNEGDGGDEQKLNNKGQKRARDSIDL